MKTISKGILLVLATIILNACGSGTDKQFADAEGFGVIENDIKNKFGDEAYYTDLTVMYDKSIGNMISVTVTEAPESLKMGQWNSTQGNWKQNSEITLEVPEGNNASDFMFQLGDRINLVKLGGLIEKSSKKLTTEKNIENPRLEMVSVKFPKNGNLAKTEYYVKLQPENGGTSFTFYYTLDGELIKMDY